MSKRPIPASEELAQSIFIRLVTKMRNPSPFEGNNPTYKDLARKSIEASEIFMNEFDKYEHERLEQ